MYIEEDVVCKFVIEPLKIPEQSWGMVSTHKGPLLLASVVGIWPILAHRIGSLSP